LSAVSVARDGHLHVVTISHPPLNLYDSAMHAGLVAALDSLEGSALRGVLWRAEGRVVSAGVDVKLFAAAGGPDGGTGAFEDLVSIARRVDALPCPVVFAAHALCLTWAFELALACDLIVAGESAGFGLVERRVGLTPAMGGTQRLAERAGSGRAKELVMTGSVYDAATMERWNVVNRLLPDEGFDAAARAFASELAAGPTIAHAATKAVVRDFLEGGLELANDRVGKRGGDLFATEDLQNALQAFLTSGPGSARFEGR
jgi:enoyl-CoA hydratase/carnithine racemase